MEEKNKIPISFFVLLMLIGIACISGYTFWLEGKYNEKVIELHNCTDQLLSVPLEDSEQKEEAWYKNIKIKGFENGSG